MTEDQARAAEAASGGTLRASRCHGGGWRTNAATPGRSRNQRYRDVQTARRAELADAGKCASHPSRDAAPGHRGQCAGCVERDRVRNYDPRGEKDYLGRFSLVAGYSCAPGTVGLKVGHTRGPLKVRRSGTNNGLLPVSYVMFRYRDAGPPEENIVRKYLYESGWFPVSHNMECFIGTEVQYAALCAWLDARGWERL